MLYGLYVSAAGAVIEDARHDVATNNIANINTPGFRRELALIRAREAEAIEGAVPSFATPLDAAGGGVLISETHTRHAQAPINVTDNPFDLAIDGEGFFEVTDGTNSYFTRAGAFRRDTTGRLAMPDGVHFLADPSGKPLAVPLEGDIAISHDGQMSVDSSPVGRIELKSFSNPNTLVKVGGNRFENRSGSVALAGGGRIKQGALEVSGASPSVELVDSITAMRGYEANMQMIKMQDQTLGDLISLGRVQI